MNTILYFRYLRHALSSGIRRRRLKIHSSHPLHTHFKPPSDSTVTHPLRTKDPFRESLFGFTHKTITVDGVNVQSYGRPRGFQSRFPHLSFVPLAAALVQILHPPDDHSSSFCIFQWYITLVTIIIVLF